MATDTLFSQITQDPQLFLWIYKVYLHARCSPATNQKETQTLDLSNHGLSGCAIESKQQTITAQHEEELELIGHGNEAEQIVDKEVEEKLPEIQVEKTAVIQEETDSKKTLNDRLKEHIGSITLNVKDLFQSKKNKEIIQKLIACDISYLKDCLQENRELNPLIETMKLTFDLKLRQPAIPSEFRTITKMFISFPSFDFQEVFNPIISLLPNLEEIDCEYYKLRLGHVYNSKDRQILEISIRDQIHPSVLENILLSDSKISQLNVNLKYWLEYAHRTIETNITLGVLVPSGQSRLFKLLFKNHRLGSYLLYPIEDEMISLNEFRKIWSEELGIIGLIYNLQEEIVHLNRISSKLFQEEDKVKVKNLVKKVDRLVDRIDDSESNEFIANFEECLIEFEEIRKITHLIYW
ncbi:predicted protein [Naegleria gruberi]|uniref:Predicted protein n=1 Tax=Naegleria gruberi TaxID=5762 RepID=D2VI68_NAEGR|nr:uncharacterized protein NAEGRDRAFT_49749 [Naegleria gruberi]EFC43542.1 predicted protein [Naegleria gruberi]|eukprot:XP_002676286.1 predicted protein [Naegleria gruberi strain NEG-M]